MMEDGPVLKCPSTTLLFIAFVASALAMAETSRAVPAKEDVVAIMKKTADWQIAHPKHEDTDWSNGTFFAGLTELYKCTKDSKHLDILLRMGTRNRWKPGRRLRHADDHCIGQTYIELYLITGTPRMLAPIKATFDEMMAAPKKGRVDWYWCDALFMAPPTLARLATATSDRKYLDFMNVMWWDTIEYLYDPEEHLYYRDANFFAAREKNGKKMFWSRGNGWVLAGLCRVLQHMPEDYPYRERYLALFAEISARVASLQQDDGFWRSSLLDPDSYPGGESSGTALFTYALAWGVNRGLLAREEYLPGILKGWEALVGAVEDNGKLGWVQSVGARPAQPKRENFATYGTGAFLLAGSEIARLSAAAEPAERSR